MTVRIIYIILFLTLASVARAETITFRGVESVGLDRAVVVTVLGTCTKSVKYGDKALQKLCSQKTEFGYGYVSIYGLQLDSGHTTADMVVEVEDDKFADVVVCPLSNVDQLMPFSISCVRLGYNSPIILSFEDTSAKERLIGGVSFFALDWSGVRIENLPTNVITQNNLTTLSFLRKWNMYWVAAHVLVNPKENLSVRYTRDVRRTRQ